ncbi:MAG: hypothetical protein WCR20_11150, partial [Verrucomicrobiota bacterium]
MPKKPSLFARIREEIQAALDDRIFSAETRFTRLTRFFHFWVMVWRSVERNRLFVRASGLAYMTLLSLIPMLAVAVIITSSFLKKEGEDRIDQFIVQFVASVTPPDLLTNKPESATPTVTTEEVSPADGSTNSVAPGGPAIPAFAQVKEAVRARREIARAIHDFIQNTRSGALGLTGSLLLIFAAISMLSRVETTFNDIWGVQRG